MFENLDQVDWKNIETAFGSADVIPKLLNDLAATDIKIREHVYEELLELTNHQGSIYEVSAYITPFLFQLLDSNNSDNNTKKYALSLIMGFMPSNDSWGKINPFNVSGDYKIIWDTIVINYNTLLRLSKIPDQWLEIETLGTLSFVAAYKRATFPSVLAILKQTIQSGKNDNIRASAILNIGYLYHACSVDYDLTLDKDELINLLLPLWSYSDQSPVSLSAALSLALIQKETLDDIIEDYLVNIGANPVWREQVKYDYIAIKSIGLVSDKVAAISILWHLGVKRHVDTLENILKLVDNAREARRLSCTLLDWIFFQDRRVFSSAGRLEGGRYVYRNLTSSLDPSDLTTYKKQALLAVINNDTVWKEKHNLLERYGLLAERDKAKRQLQQTSTWLQKITDRLNKII